jgi:hypothetical protein
MIERRFLPLSCASAAAVGLVISASALAAGQPKPPPKICIEGSSTYCAATADPASTKIKWHPGHYYSNHFEMWRKGRPASADSYKRMASVSAIKGMLQPIAWGVLEPDKPGVYDFTAIDTALARVKAQNRRLIVTIWAKSCCTKGNDPSSWLPAYIVNDAKYGTLVSSYGTMSKIWEQATMDRLIALYKAIGARYDGDPAFEGIGNEETAVGFVDAVPASYTNTGMAAQYQRLQDAWRAAAPHTTMFMLANWLGNASTDLKSLHDNAVETMTGVGGPDLAPLRPVDGYLVVQGKKGGHDYRNEIPQLYDFEYMRYLQGQSAKDAYDYAQNTLRAEYLTWPYQTSGTSGQNWSTGIVPMINANPTTVSTCPKAYVGGCDTQ